MHFKYIVMKFFFIQELRQLSRRKKYIFVDIAAI